MAAARADSPAAPQGAWGLGAGEGRDAVWDGRVIDADAHVQLPGLEVLADYLDDHWLEFIRERGFLGPGLGRTAMVGSVRTYPPNAPTSVREEWRPAAGRMPASELALVQGQLLDPWRLERAILTCNPGVDFVRHPDFALALARAVNDWLIAEWLERDERLRASIVVPSRQPAQIAAEIERVGSHPGFVSVFMPVRSDRPYGNRIWHPVYRAMVAHDLVMNLHWGGTPDGPPTPVGWPSWYAEEYALEPQLYMAQVTSLLAEGAFAEFPQLRVTVAEGGFTWLPSLWWRLQKDWKGLRRDTPWVSRPVIETIREHMRFTVAPTDAGPPEELARVLEWLGSDEILLFATDYPHRHEDDLRALLAAAPESMRAPLMAASAAAWYRL